MTAPAVRLLHFRAARGLSSPCQSVQGVRETLL